MRDIINRVGNPEDRGRKRRWPIGWGEEVTGQSLNGLLKEAEVKLA